MDHLDLAGVLTTPPQWNLPAFEQQDAIYLSSSRQMLEPIMEETSEDEEYALNSWQQYDQQSSDAECGATTEGESVCGGTGGAGGASFWSSAESDTGSVIRIEVTKDNDSTSERDFLCPAKRPRRCEESLAQSLPEEEVILRRPLYGVEKNNSLERFLNYENFSRDSWGTNSQQRSSVGSRRGFDDFYSDSDSLSYNSLSRSSSLIQFESLERQLLMQEQHASMTSLGNSSPSLMSFEINEDTQNKPASNSANNSANNSRRGSQSSLLKKYESLDGRLHQTYYDLDKLNFDDMDNSSGDNFSRNTNLKMAELRSDSESSSEGSEGSSRPQSVLSPADLNDNEFLFKKFNRTNSQQSKKGKSSAENLSEDSGYCEPSLGFGLRRSKSQSLLKNYEKFSEEEEEMENKSLIHGGHKQTFNELNAEQQQQQQQQQANNKHSIINEFKNTTTRHETISSPPLSPHLEFIRHKQRTEAHSPSPVSSEVSTSSSTSSQSTTQSNNSSTSSSSASSTSSATTCASKASFTWLMPSAATTARQSSRVHAAEEENQPSQISINDLRELKTSNEENVQIFSGKLKNIKEFSSISPPGREEYVQLVENEDECLECKNICEEYELNECRNCGEKVISKPLPYQEYFLSCQKCKENFQNIEEIECGNSEINLNCENCGEKYLVDIKLNSSGGTLNCEKVRKKLNAQQLQLITDTNHLPNKWNYGAESEHRTHDNSEPDKSGEFENTEINENFCLDYDSSISTPESLKRVQTYENSAQTLSKYHKHFDSSCSSTPETSRRLLTTAVASLGCSASSDSDYSPLRVRKNFNNLMPSWPVKTSSVPNELNTIGRKKKHKKSKFSCSPQPATTSNKSPEPSTDNDSVNDSSLTSNEDLDLLALNLKRSLSWSFQPILDLETSSLCVEAKNLGILHQSYHNLALLNLESEQENSLSKKMAEKRISSDYEAEIVCKNNFLLDELSAHYDRTVSILNDRPVDQTDAVIKTPQAPQRLHNRKTSNSSCSAGEEVEAEQVHHVQLVIRKPPARQKRDKDGDKTNSLTQDYTFTSIMQSGGKTFDQDPTILKTSYAQSLEKCNFDCKELSTQDLSKPRAIPKRRFHSQANDSKKKNLVSSTPNLNAYDFNHQDEIEDDMFVSSAHNSMHQLPLSQTQKPLGILLPAGSRTSFGKEVSFCPVVSKFCWQEQSSEECNDGTEEHLQGDEESEDELLDNADATVIYNTKENENIASKYHEEFVKKEQENVCQENSDEVIKEKAVLKEINGKHKVENVMLTKEHSTERESENEREEELNGNKTQQELAENKQSEKETSKIILDYDEKETKTQNNETGEQEELLKAAIQSSSELLPVAVTTVSLTTNVNNETLKTQTDRDPNEQNKRVNNITTSLNTNTPAVRPTVVVARPLSIQLPILSEPPINRAHHILYASQQMLDNFQRQQQNEEYEHCKSQSTQNLSKMSGKTVDLQPQQCAATNSKLNNNNEVMKSKFKHEEKHPNSKGFLSRFANGFRFSLRRNKKKLQQKENQQLGEADVQETKSNGLTNQNKSKSLPPSHKQADFIHIPLKGPLPENRNGNSNKQTNGNTANNGNVKNTTMLGKQKGAKTKETNDKQQKVTGKPPIPPQQQQQLQQMLKLQSAQSSPQQLQQQPLVEVGLSRFYTEAESNHPATAHNPGSVTQDFLTSERDLYNENHNQQQFTTATSSQSCANNQQLTNAENDDTEMTAVNTNNTATYEFSSPSRASVSQKTQMFNNLSRKTEQQQPKIGLIETNLDTHETIITGKTRSLINIGPNQQQQQRFAGNKRLHTTTNTHNNHHHQQFNRHHNLDGNEADDDDYDDNDDDEVVVRPDGTVVVIKNAGSSGASQAQQIASVRRPHKSMEFLLDKENQKDVMTTSEESQTEFKTHEVSNVSSKPLRKKKLRRSLTLRKESSLLEPHAIFSTDSDSDCKPQSNKIQSCTLPKSKKCTNYVKKLIFKTLNNSAPLEQPSLLNNELSILELDSSLIRQVNSPSKIKTAYTLTVMSSPSPHSESDFCDSDLPKTPIKEMSRSWPSLLEVGMDDDTNLLKDKSVTTEFTDLAKSKVQQDQQKLLMDSFIDQGFETGSNDMDSPLRMPRKINHDIEKSITKLENPKNFSTPNKDKPVKQVFTALAGTAQAHTISPISSNYSPRRPSSLTMTVINEDSSTEDSEELQYTPSSLNESATFFNQDQSTTPLEVTHKVNSSQFWITSGEFTAAITIDYFESKRLMLLSNIYAQKSLESREMNFGIDDQKFCLDSSAMPDDIIRKVPKVDNCSQYWFSTGDVVIPFTGKQMSTQKIQSFFNYIREFMEESGSIRFGIDSYEFSNIYQQTENCTTLFNGNTWTQAVSPIKTSDLDQSDLDSEEFERSLTFSALSGVHSDTVSLKSDDLINPQQASFTAQHSSGSLEQIFEDARHLNLSKTQTDKQALETQFTVPEMLKTLQSQQTKLKSLEERMLSCTETSGCQKIVDINESPDYMRKLRSIISAIDNIGRGNGFNACTIEQLESFMFFLSRYADLCLANCTAHIEKILDVVMNQRSFQV